MSKPAKPLLAIVIPCYNEALRIPKTLQKLSEFLPNLESYFQVKLVVVNDGSKDDTVKSVTKTLAKLANLEKLTTVVNNKINQGKGYAVKCGIKKARRADYFYLADADLSSSWKVLLQLYQALKKQNAQVVIASRALKPEETTQNFFRQTLAQGSNLITKILFGLAFKDTQCGYKLFSSNCYPVLSKIQINRFGFDIEVLYKLQKSGKKIIEIPVQWVYVEGSKVKPLDYFKTLWDIIKIRLTLN